MSVDVETRDWFAIFIEQRKAVRRRIEQAGLEYQKKVEAALRDVENPPPALPAQGPIRVLFTGPIEMIEPREKAPVQIRDIKQAVCVIYGVDMRQLEGTKRRFAFPRQVAIWLASIACEDMSMVAICKSFGSRDHTTGLYARNKIAFLVKKGEYVVPASLRKFIASEESACT